MRRHLALMLSISRDLRRYTARVIADYPKLLEGQSTTVRMDAIGLRKVVESYFKSIRVAYAAAYKTKAKSFEDSIEQTSRLASFENLREFKAGISDALSRMGKVTPKTRALAIAAEPDIPKSVSKKWTDFQMSLIRDKGTPRVPSIPEKHFERLQNVVQESVHSGLRVEEVRGKLKELDGVNDRRAEVIARDQIGKYNGKMTEIRHQDLGITHYFWRTSGDERVRDEHRKRDGERFAYAKPPKDGHPGEAVQCRCWADPDIESALEE